MKLLRDVRPEVKIKNESRAPDTCSWQRCLGGVVCRMAAAMFADIVEAVMLFQRNFSPITGGWFILTQLQICFCTPCSGSFLFQYEYGKCEHQPWLWGIRPADCLCWQWKSCYHKRRAVFHSLSAVLEHGHTNPFVCVRITNWLLSSISECLIACGHLIKHCMLCKDCTFFAKLASWASPKKLHHFGSPMWG